VGYRRLAAIVSEHKVEAVSPTEGAFWQHETVCEALMDGRTVLPARFGLLFSSEDQLRSALAGKYDELVRAIGRLAGRVELGVRVVWKDGRDQSGRSEGAEEASGRAYLEARLAERRKTADLARNLHEALTPLAAESRTRRRADAGLLFSAAYLVERDGVDAFLRRIDSLEAEHDDLAFLCTGPWPPYNFVAEEG
jgi:hypothetical protein